MTKNILDKDKNFNTKIVIIGAGPAGISIALELEKKKISCILIEAGSENYSLKSQEFYKGEVVGEFPKSLDVVRLRMFGGSTGHWGGICRPLDEYDFEKWPISKKVLDPYLNKACDILKIKNDFLTVAASDNFELINFHQSPVRFREFYKHCNNSNFIKLLSETTVIKIKEGKKEGFAEDVECYSEKLGKINVRGNHIVLAAGGIENSRILLVTKESNKKLLDNNMPIGNYWHEHPWQVLGSGVVNKKKFINIFKNKEKYKNINKYIKWYDGALSYSFSPNKKFIDEKQILNSCCFISLIENKYENFREIAKNLFCLAPNLSKKYLKLMDLRLLCGLSIISSWEQDPEFKNRIELSKTQRDDFGLPRIKMIYEKSELVRDTARECVEEIGKYFIENDLGRVVGKSFLYNKSEQYISDAGYHHFGGTIMGNDSKSSVVNKNLKVHGSKNLYIAGSSVFPTAGYANPTLTIIQLSLRLSEYLSNKINLA